MADFKIAHKLTSIIEAGYTNHPEDAGNWSTGRTGIGQLIGTNRGISAPVLWNYLGHMPTINEMKTLSEETAEEIYRKKYWDLMKGDQIVHQSQANVIYDRCVNMGVPTAIKLTQRALGIPENGIMDQHTLDILNNKR